MGDFFVNDRYKMLKTLSEHQITIADEVFIPVTQVELGKLMNLSKVTVNRLLNELIDNGYVEVYNNTKGRYQLTEAGKRVIEKYS